MWHKHHGSPKSLATWLYVLQLVYLIWNEASELLIICPLWRECTGHWWSPTQRANNVESVSMAWRHDDVGGIVWAGGYCCWNPMRYNIIKNYQDHFLQEIILQLSRSFSSRNYPTILLSWSTKTHQNIPPWYVLFRIHAWHRSINLHKI